MHSWIAKAIGWTIFIVLAFGVTSCVRWANGKDEVMKDKFWKQEYAKFDDFCATLNAEPVFRSDAWLCVENGIVDYKMTDLPTEPSGIVS